MSARSIQAHIFVSRLSLVPPEQIFHRLKRISIPLTGAFRVQQFCYTDQTITTKVFKRYLKGIIEWYVKGVPSLTCRMKQ